MVRKLILATAGSLVFCSTAFGLGLGDLQLKSNLNQTFSASIEVRDLDGLGQDEVVVHLAPPEEFARAGIDRGSYLQDFRFAIQVSGGRGQIRVTSVPGVGSTFSFNIVTKASEEHIKTYVHQNMSKLNGKRVLELGCGLGLCGIVAGNFCFCCGAPLSWNYYSSY